MVRQGPLGSDAVISHTALMHGKFNNRSRRTENIVTKRVDFVLFWGEYVREGLCPKGILSEGILSGGICPFTARKG
jgi:hypothetical protein